MNKGELYLIFVYLVLSVKKFDATAKYKITNIDIKKLYRSLEVEIAFLIYRYKTVNNKIT